jgi:hypothetical protein
LGGVVVLRLKDLNDAVALLSKHLALPFGVAMEIRPIDEEASRRWKARPGRRQTGCEETGLSRSTRMRKPKER